MEFISGVDIQESTGLFAFIYGGTGVGKSTSLIQSLPDPILYIMTEPRDPAAFQAAANRPGVEIYYGQYENWYDLINLTANPSNFDGYNSVVVDSITYLMKVRLTGEITNESYEALPADKKSRRSLVTQTRMALDDWGGMANQMFRLFEDLGTLSTTGKCVVVTALLTSHPKWSPQHEYAPALAGNQFSEGMPSGVDLIGWVRDSNVVDRNTGQNTGEITWPPIVDFRSNATHIGKWTGIRPQTGVIFYLNMKDIIEAKGCEFKSATEIGRPL